MTAPASQLARLVARFPERFIDRDPGGNLYVSHSTVNEWLLGICGPFSFELVQIVRGDVAEVAPNPQGSSKRAKAGTPALQQVVVGGVWRLSVEVDGCTVRVEEAGDCEDPANWRHDGQRLKQAASDALKRCGMRVGLGLHLWSGDAYVLDQRLTTTSNGSTTSGFESDSWPHLRARFGPTVPGAELVPASSGPTSRRAGGVGRGHGGPDHGLVAGAREQGVVCPSWRRRREPRLRSATRALLGGANPRSRSEASTPSGGAETRSKMGPKLVLEINRGAPMLVCDAVIGVRAS